MLDIPTQYNSQNKAQINYNSRTYHTLPRKLRLVSLMLFHFVVYRNLRLQILRILP